MAFQPLRGAPLSEPSAHTSLQSHRWLTLLIVLAAAFMVILDYNIVNVAIPTIQRELQAQYGQVQLVITGYGLAYAVLLITGGRLGDRFGYKRLFLCGTLGFTLASLLCGLAPTANLLIGARILQGGTAALMFPQVLSVIQINFSPQQRILVFGIYGAVLGIALIAGQILGGVLIAANLFNLSWRTVFLINVLIGGGTILAALPLLSEARAPASTRLDLGGVCLASLGLLLLIYPLIVGREAGWPWWSWLSLLTAFLVFALFIRYERWLFAQHGSPLFEPSLVHDRAFVVGLLIVLILFQSTGSFFLVLALYLQQGLQSTALTTGLTFLPLGIGFFLASILATRLAPRVGSRRFLALGAFVQGVGVLLTLILVQRAGGSSPSVPFLLAAFGICGFGQGCVVTPLFNTILAGISRANVGTASGILSTVQQIGLVLGVAVIGILFFGSHASQADSLSVTASQHVQQSLQMLSVPASVINKRSLAVYRCVHDRATTSDPTMNPGTCTILVGEAPIQQQVVDKALRTADAQDAASALATALRYNVTLLGITVVLALLLPRKCSENRKKQDRADEIVCLTPHGGV